MAKDEQEVRGLARLSQAIARLRALIIPVMLIGFVAGAIALWWKYGEAIVGLQPGRYHVQLERMHVTAPPAWVKADVASEVFHDAGWHETPLSILESDATVRVAQAFEQHTWVAKVTRVTKESPASVNVVLDYRRPAAMVEVDYQGQSGLLPVDTLGVLLPPEDFTAQEALTFPRITVDYAGPRGSIGTPWGDHRVVESASIAALLANHWKALGMYRIVALPSEQPASIAPPNYELHTRGGSRVLWGRAPGSETGDEASAEQKLSRLERYVQQHGALDSGEGKIEIDVRDAQKLSARPLTRS